MTEPKFTTEGHRILEDFDGVRFDDKYTEMLSVGSYYPTRLEYLAGKIVVGLLTGKSEKSFERAVRVSVILAKDMERELDQAQDV